MIRSQVEGDHRGAVSHEGTDRPGADAPEAPVTRNRSSRRSRRGPRRFEGARVDEPADPFDLDGHDVTGVQEPRRIAEDADPDGVPVAMTSPGSSVNAREQWLTIWATLKYIWEVLASWTRSSPTVQQMARSCGSGSRPR
jgi:hypothetical protein